MELNSALYKCLVMHNRLAPKKHRFTYNIFMFWLNIDEIDNAAKKLKLFSRNSFNVFNFMDKDHFKFAKGDQRNKLSVRQKLNDYFKMQGIENYPHTVFLLTHTRMLGHVFNPISLYYCFDENSVCNYVITELSNTFGEMKFFLIDKKTGNTFEQNEVKYFYVSPFTDMDTEFEFKFHVPDEKLQVMINVNDKKGKKFFISTLTGKRKALTDARLLSYVFRFPFVTLKVIGGIHYEAFRLWLKKLPYHKKGNDPELQKGITNV